MRGSGVPPSGGRSGGPPTQAMGDLRNSQDMLRRLLPNVNVSFNNESSSMDYNQSRNNYSQGKQAVTQQLQAAQAVAQQQAQTALQGQPRSPAQSNRQTKAQLLLAKQQGIGDIVW